jgi:peptide deformylase
VPYRTIQQWPSKILGHPADPASIEDIKSVSADLIDTLKIVTGLGLAAPQIGLSKKVLVIDTAGFPCENPDKDLGDPNYWVVANPVVSNQAGEWRWQEACLSVPLVKCFVTRYETLTLEYDDFNGDRKKINLETPLSLAVQHEADHLEGKTILDRIGKSTAALYKKRIRKAILKSLRRQREMDKNAEQKIGRLKKKSHLSVQERKKRKKIRRMNSSKK